MDKNDHAKHTLEPHVLIFPTPLQGPVSCFLKLAELLCISGIHVTFLNTDYIHRPLIRHTQVLSRFRNYPNFQFETIPDGLEHDNPVSIEKLDEMIDAVNAAAKPLFRDMMISGRWSRSSERPVTVMIVDAFFSFAVELGLETSTPVFCFQTISPWEQSDELVTSVPGTQHFLRKRDLAGFCQTDDLSNMELQFVLQQALITPQTQGLILNTFEELDALVLPHIRKVCPNVYPIGPLHSLYRSRLLADTTQILENISSNSVWKEDKTCLSWLDKHPPKSVAYISFGSLATINVDQMLEIWHGLVHTGKPFLWVKRPESITGEYNESQVPNELLERTKEIGCIVDWAPQEEVLAHPAVGVFLTHSGWNSTIESIAHGVPIICWPYFYDQQVNSRFVGEVWKVGVDMKDLTCDRFIIEKAVRDVMDTRQGMFTQSATAWQNLAKESIGETGSSSKNFALLLDDIRELSSIMK
ncbi:UDP-glucuronosyl/UDP-glucosyltransferase [Artemisia annua]|uniref:Glycosyltransferase n=1 Tax=Artemisia annua TaxID=35608 RepID=A0A2U1L778_ARTAN|nr:UDP-glucuronosyl/UDP-glucosyltransferase [Artemisia annua]